MNKKPVTPTLHGIIDYIFSGIQIIAPAALKFNAETVKIYQVSGAVFLSVNAVTDTPVAIRKAISLKTHQKTDAAFLAGLSLITFANFIRKDSKTLHFHLSFLAIAVTHYVLTDYNTIAGK